MFFQSLVIALVVCAAQGMTIVCDAPGLFAESRFLNASSFASAIDTHCWPSVSADGTEVAVVDTWETRLDQHMSEIHNRLHEMSQMLEQWNAEEDHDEEDLEEDHEEDHLEEDHEEEDLEEDHEEQMEAGKIVPEII
jgi:hypothetical protein